MRENQSVTYAVAASECTSACGTSHSVDSFRWASPEGDVALFESCDKLTDESTAFSGSGSCTNINDAGLGSELEGEQAKLYRWDLNQPEGQRLVDLTVDHEPGDGLAPKFKGLIEASDDGNVVYFIARGQIVSGAPTPPDEGLKLYRWRWNGGAPDVEYLGPYVSTWINGTAKYPPSGTPYYQDLDPNVSNFNVRVTPDGRYLMITSRLRYDPIADRDDDVDAYRWDEEGGWLCVSCQEPGTPSAGNVNSMFLYTTLTDRIVPMAAYGAHDVSISADGKRIVFSTPDALLPQDVNGNVSCPETYNESSYYRAYTCQDIYEWYDGRLSLLSTGTGSDPFILAGTDAKGDVFFETRQRLVGWDLDDGVDIYTVRAGGGFAEPAPQPPGCEGESCRGAGTTTTAGSGAGTAVFEGPGDSTARPTGQTCPKGKRQVRRNGKTRCVSKGRKQRKANKGQHARRAANHNRRASR